MPVRQRGFTLIELIVVLVIVGLVFGVAVPHLERLSPRYSMRAAARRIASDLEYIQSTSSFRQKTYGVRYDLGENVSYTIMPPEKDDVWIPFDKWPLSTPKELPKLVEFRAVVLADNTVFEGEEVADIMLDPLGASGSHVVILEDTDGHVMSVKFNALTGTVDFLPGEVGFARYE